MIAIIILLIIITFLVNDMSNALYKINRTLEEINENIKKDKKSIR